MARHKVYTKDWLEELCKESVSYAEVLAKAGRKHGGGNQATLKNKIKEFDIDLSHFTGQCWNKGAILLTEQDTNRIFCKGSSCQKINNYRHILIRLKGFHYCEECGLTHWNKKEITLEIHHLDGDKTNNEVSNLQFLCPNCHSQTDNFRRSKITHK